MDAIIQAHEGDVQMIDSSIVRVHQQGATAKRLVEIVVWAAPERAHDQNPCGRRKARSAYQAQADS